ncbi:hypothetical protein V7068_07040 [Bacillus sp. JJ634]
MKSLQDALYNWLTIKVVCDARPTDTAAKQTEQFFSRLLEEDHQLSHLSVMKESPFYFITFWKDGSEQQKRFPIEMIDVMLNQIELTPDKYRNVDE